MTTFVCFEYFMKVYILIIIVFMKFLKRFIKKIYPLLHYFLQVVASAAKILNFELDVEKKAINFVCSEYFMKVHSLIIRIFIKFFKMVYKKYIRFYIIFLQIVASAEKTLNFLPQVAFFGWIHFRPDRAIPSFGKVLRVLKPDVHSSVGWAMYVLEHPLQILRVIRPAPGLKIQR